MRKILYAAAHSGFDLGEVPLGGGAAVCQHLVSEWVKTKPFEWEVLGPALLGGQAPKHKDLVRYSEFDYARFCRQFQERLTETILTHDPQSTAVLCNDVSEGPDFARLSAKGYRLFTIYHVDVVDYFTAIYLKGIVNPESTTAFFRAIDRAGFARLVPKMLRLIWKKQEDSVHGSAGLIVPSERMKEVMLQEYPGVDKNKIHVIPWGAWEDPAPAEDIAREKAAILEQNPIPDGAFVLLMLSRISPEKGQDRLLKALAKWERQADFPKGRIVLLISGEAAYMMGKRYEAELKRLAGRLRHTSVHFVGYAAPARKRALFELSDLYVFPSRHESYGLTLLEALNAGLPVLATPSHGACEVFQPGFGEMISSGPESAVPSRLVSSLKRLLADRSTLEAMGRSAISWASHQRFSDAALRLTELLASQ